MKTILILTIMVALIRIGLLAHKFIIQKIINTKRKKVINEICLKSNINPLSL